MGIVPTANINIENSQGDDIKPLSILIAAYQTQDFIEETLDSIENQTYFMGNDDFEVLVGVDGCEKTLNKLMKIRHKYRNLRIFMMSKNMGTYVTFNTLFEISRHPYILRFDSDDIMNSNMVERYVAKINSFDIVRSQYNIYSEGKLSNYPFIDYANGVVLFRRNVIEACGGYQAWKCAADTDLLKRVKMGFREGLIKDHLFKYRWHGNSLTKKIDGVQRAKYHKMMKDNRNMKVNRVTNQYKEINNMNNSSIVELSKKYNTDKKMNDGIKARNGLLGHDYAQQYDDFLKGREIKKMLEIGVSFGGSIKMWDEYFNGECEIYGIDIEETRFKIKELVNDHVRILIGDQGSVEFLNQNFNTGDFDFIVDDGSHRIKHQQVSFKTLFPQLKSGGLYVIEDLHTSRIPNFYDNIPETTTLEMLEYLRDGKKYESNYLNSEDYQYLLNNVKNIKIFENKIPQTGGVYIIAFIEKK